jgi:2,5-diketo-D-gluconate reductase B
MKMLDIKGTKVPALGFGTWQITGDACREAVADALDIGYRHIDTAQVYGNEAEVGQAIAESGVAREEVFLTTKVWNDKVGRQAILDSVDESLEKLRVDHVDLLLIHWPIAEQRPIEETVDVFAELQESRKTRAIGVSNFVPSHVERAVSRAPIFANQVEYHPLLGQGPLLELAAAHDFMLTAYSPLARFSDELFSGDGVVASIAAECGRSPAQVVLRWFMEQDRVSAIPKASSHGHRKQNFEIFDFELSAEQVAAIDGLEAGRRMVTPKWSPAEWGVGG